MVEVIIIVPPNLPYHLCFINLYVWFSFLLCGRGRFIGISTTEKNCDNFSCVFETANQLLTRYPIYLAPWMNGHAFSFRNVNKLVANEWDIESNKSHQSTVTQCHIMYSMYRSTGQASPFPCFSCTFYNGWNFCIYSISNSLELIISDFCLCNFTFICICFLQTTLTATSLLVGVLCCIYKLFILYHWK